MPFQPAQQPRLTWWSHTWRVLAMLAISLSSITTTSEDNIIGPWWWGVDVLLGIVSFVLVHWRRRYPVAVTTVVTVLSAVSITSGGPAILALVSLATRRRWREIVPLSVLSLGTAGVVYFVWPSSDDGLPGGVLLLLAFSVPIIAVAVAWGMYIGSRRELLWTLRDRARRAEDEQATRVSAARTAERSRIAREMHDVLAHRISLVTMHADAMVYRTDLDADRLRASAAVIQESSHRALVELREVLGVLRDDPGDAEPERPQPSASDVVALVEELVQDGMRVDADLTADLSAVPDTTGRTLYRVVQEGLTNARKHAPNARVALAVTGRAGEGLEVRVRNPLAPGARTSAPHSGLGLVGLAERAGLAGGRIAHAVEGDAFVLDVWLPWPS